MAGWFEAGKNFILINERLDAINDQFDSLYKNLEKIAKSIEKNDDRIRALENNASHQDAKLESIISEAKSVSLAATTKAMQEMSDKYLERIIALENEVKNMPFPGKNDPTRLIGRDKKKG